MTPTELISKHQLNQTFLAAKMQMSKQTFANKLKTGFTVPEAIQFRDYIIELGVDCSNIENVNFDGTLNALVNAKK